MDNFLQSLLGDLKGEANPLQALLMDYLGLRQNPQGGTYRDFEEPLSTQYGTFMDPYSLNLAVPENVRIMEDVKRQRNSDMMDANWEKDKWNWPLRSVTNIGHIPPN